MVTDRRYQYGDLNRRLDFAPAWFNRFDGSTDHWKEPYRPLVIGLAFEVGGCGRFWSVDSAMDPQSDDHY